MKGYCIIRLPRINESTTASDLQDMLKGVDIVINLAGAPIIGRWTSVYKKLVFNSRIITTRKLVETINSLDIKPKLFVSASAVGIYNSAGINSEYNYNKADDFLGELCNAWEAEASRVNSETRLVITRIGIVLDNSGGALKKILPLFRYGLGGRIASGKQGFSWIHSKDAIRAFEFLIENNQLSGVFNLTAPEMVDNNKFTKELAAVLKRPAYFHVPAQAIKLLFGEASVALLSGQFALPENLKNVGFEFCFPELKGALYDIVE
jgi:hypothetical protein